MGSFVPSGFTVRTDVRNGVARLALLGELDLAVVPTLQEQLDRMLNDGVEAVLLDLRDLTFMDSSGLRLLLGASEHAKQNRHRLAIVGVGGAARRLFNLTRTEDSLIDESEGMELIGRFTKPEAGTDDAMSTTAMSLDE